MEVGDLRGGYLANLEEYPSDEEKVFVMKDRGNDELAPSDELLGDYKRLEEELGNRWEAWDRCNYESRFRKEMQEGKSQEKIEEIAERVANGKNVRLICYEKNPPCHRFILKELIGEKITRILVTPLEGGESIE